MTFGQGLYLFIPSVLYFLGGLFATKNQQHFQLELTKTLIGISFGLTVMIALMQWFSSGLLIPVENDFPLLKLSGFATILTLVVNFLGFTTIRYMSTYLRENIERPVVIRWSCFTLSAVLAFFASNHLGVSLITWILCSACLNQIIALYQKRPNIKNALIQKYLFSRVAEGCLLLAMLLIVQQHGSLNFSALIANGPSDAATGILPWALIALAVILKSAQLPFQGWLISLIELPTPISALLHAGVINMGAFLLIRLSQALVSSPALSLALVAIGSITAFIGAYAMMNQTSIKARLAWSTCSQMGFLLVEFGLGLYAFAALHMVAHSMYKAHAFLNCGTIQKRQPMLDNPLIRKNISQLIGASVLVLLWSVYLPVAVQIGLALMTFLLTLLLSIRKSKNQQKLVAGVIHKLLILVAISVGWHVLLTSVWAQGFGLTNNVDQLSPALAFTTALVMAIFYFYFTNRFARIHPDVLKEGFYISLYTQRIVNAFLAKAPAFSALVKRKYNMKVKSLAE